MELTVLPLTSTSDIPTIARIHLAAFLTNKFYRAVWYKGVTPAVIESQESRHLNFLTSDPTVRYAKVVGHAVSDPGEPDSNSEGTIIAFAKMACLHNGRRRQQPPRCGGPLMAPGLQRALCRSLLVQTSGRKA